ncbi:MAG: DUF294 nucleotidyltransferase-like domain-containing protein [bacterium]
MITEDLINFLKEVPPFQFLEETVLRDVATNISMEFFPKNTVILTQDGPPSDTLRVIKKGGVKVFMKSEEGEEMVIDYRGEGDTFGFLSLIGKDRQRTTVVAIDDTICYLIDKEKIIRLLESNPAFTEYFLKSHFSKYIHKTYSEMQSKSLYYGASDRLLFTTQVGEIATKPVVTVSEETTIRDAAQKMVDQKVSSLIVLDKGNLPSGIITDRDLREKVVARGRDVSAAVKGIMSLPMIRVDARDYCFEAVLKMIRYNIHHVIVVKEGDLKGVLTNHDLMMLQGNSPLSFAKDIENQNSIEGLIPVSHKVDKIIGMLLKEGAKASNIAKIMTELNDRIVRKVLELAETKYGAPPLTYCWICFGSEGRKEQTFRTDQDNAIIYADPETPEKAEEAKVYFQRLAYFVKEGLLQCGFPPCPANYMASNPEWCQPLRTWKRYFLNWISTPTGESLLKSLIFFDFRPLHGDFSLADSLKEYLRATVEDQRLFLGHLANMIIKNMPPIGFLKSFVVEKGGEHKNELNLKVKGLAPIVDIIRLFSLEKGISETSTLERISALIDKHAIVTEYADEIEHAFEFVMLLRMHHQLEQMESGKQPDNFLNPNMLSNLEKRTIKDAFHLISKLQDQIIERYKAMIL